MRTFKGRHVAGRRTTALLAPLLVLLGRHVGTGAAHADDRIYGSADGAGAIRVGNLDGSGLAASLFGSEGGTRQGRRTDTPT